MPNISNEEDMGEKKDEDTITPGISSDEDDSPSIGKELQGFIEQISSLSLTLKLAYTAVIAAYEKMGEELPFYTAEKVFDDSNSAVGFLQRAEYIHKLQDLNKKLRIYTLALETIPRSYLMTLISQYDAFLGKLLKVIFLIKPELLTVSEKSFSFAQLVEFGSIENAKEFILEKEIESVLRKSHTDQFAWMESKFNIPLRQNLEVWPDFVEITERRNLYVHTGGIVSSQYLKVCKENNVPLHDIKLGEELSIDPVYFRKAYHVIFELAFKLAHVLWRKFLPKELEIADLNLISIGYEDALSQENYDLTKVIFNFGTQTLKKHSSEERRLIMTVNRALGYKWGGDHEKAKEIISKEDWSASRTRFRLAQAVINDEYEVAYNLMREIGKNSNEISIIDYRSWPLFKAIKTESKFIETFQEIFGEPFDKVEISSIALPENLGQITE